MVVTSESPKAEEGKHLHIDFHDAIVDSKGWQAWTSEKERGEEQQTCGRSCPLPEVFSESLEVGFEQHEGGHQASNHHAGSDSHSNQQLHSQSASARLHSYVSHSISVGITSTKVPIVYLFKCIQ